MYTVVADGNPKPTVRWLHDGKEVKPCNRVHISNDGNLYKIEIDAVNPKDAGAWQCEISNDLGKSVLKAELSVLRKFFIKVVLNRIVSVPACNKLARSALYCKILFCRLVFCIQNAK